MSANDPDDYVRREIDWIGSPARAAAVSRHLPRRADACQTTRRAGRAASGRPGEIGYYPIRRPRPGLRYARTGRITSITGIAREFELPGGADLLAEGDDFPMQAFQVGPGVRPPVSSRRDLRDDVPLDHARLCAHGNAGRAAASSSFRRTRGP